MNKRVLFGTLFMVVLLASLHWFYLENLHHRIGGVAWNGLFQIFGNFFAGLGSFAILALVFSKKISPAIGILCAILLGFTSAYCFLNAFGIMLSI